MPESIHPVAAYRDAVVNALDAAGIGVREQAADEQAPSIGLALDPVSKVRQPTMLWTPGHGWRVAMACRGEVRGTTIRYLCRGFAPYPAEVAAQVALWLGQPDAVSDVQPVYPRHARATVLEELAGAAGRRSAAGAVSHVLIGGAGCPSWCTTDHSNDPAHAAVVRHNGKAMRIGGVDVRPTIHVDAPGFRAIPPTGPRLRVVIDGEADETPPNVQYFGVRNAGRMAALLDLAGDTSGLANAIRAAVAALDTESQAAADIVAARREQMEAAAR